MEKKKELTIRGILIIVGILFVIYSFYSFYLLVSPIVETLIKGSFNISISLFDVSSSLVLFIIGISLFFVGHHWMSSFKSLAITFVSFAVFFVTLSIFVYSFQIHTQEISDSIQPSLDMLIAQNIDSVLEEQLSEYDNTKVRLILSKSSISEAFYSNNLTLEQATMIVNALEIKNLSNQEKISFSKFLIDTTYSSLKEKNPELIDVPIPLSLLKDKFSESGFDVSQITPDEIELLDLFSEQDDLAHINILLLEDEEVRQINLGKLSEEDINLIWSNLNIKNYSISKETKEIYIKLIIGATAQELEKQNLQNLSIPIASISSQFPDEIKGFLSYDIGNPNISQKALILSKIRKDCVDSNTKEEEIKKICSMVLLSDYNYLMKNIDNVTTLSGFEIPGPVLKTLEPFSSTQLIKETLEKKTEKWKSFLIISIFFYILAHITYYLHFRLFKRELIPIHIPYFISKQNLYHLILPFVLLIILYYFLSQGYLLEIISNFLPQEMGFDSSFLANIEIFRVLISIFSKTIFIESIFIIFSILVYATFYFLLKKRVKMGNSYN